MEPIWSQKSSINRDFTVLSGVIIFIALLTSLWVAYEAFSDETQRMAVQLEAEALRIDKGFDGEISRAAYVLESIGRQVIQAGTDDKVRIAQIMRAFDNNNEQYSVFLWLDKDLQVVTSSRQGVLDTPINLADLAYLQQSQQTPFRIQVGKPAKGRITERLVLPMAMGLTDHTGKFIGSVALHIDLETLTSSIKDYIHNSSVGYTLLTDNLTILAHDETGAQLLESKSLMDTVDQRIIQNGANGVLRFPTLFSSNRLLTYYHHSLHHAYVILTSYQSDYSSIRKLVMPRLVQLTLVAAFLVSLLWLVRFRIIHPVQNLTRIGAEIIRGNADVEIPKSGPLEIRQLSQQLQSMADYIRERKRTEEELMAKVLSLKTTKDSAEISDQAKMQILRLLKPEIFPALEDILEISNLLVEGIPEEASEEDRRMLIEQLEHASIHLQEVMQEIFELPELSIPHSLATRKPADVGQLVNKCVTLLGDTLDREEVNVSIRMQADLPKLSVDELNLMHVVLHLLSACAEAIPAGGELTIEATLEETNQGTEFALMFKDNASGMDTHRISNLWRTNLPPAAASPQQPEAHGEQIHIDAVILTKKILTLHHGRMTVQNPPDKEAVIAIHFQQ